MSQCSKGVIETAQETFVLVLEMGDRTILKSPEMIKKVLQDPAVRKEIESALLAQAKTLVSKQGKGQAVSQSDMQKLGKAVATATMDATKKNVQSQIEKSSEFQKVKHSLKDLECSFKKSPVGVFVDENKALLIIVASGLAIGGATALYVVREGDFVGEQMAALANKLLSFKVLGNVVEVGAKGIKFEPSQRKVEAKAFATGTWKKVQASVEFQVATENDKLKAVGGKGEVMVKVAEGVQLKGHGQVGYKAPAQSYQPPLMYDLGLSISYKPSISGVALSVAAKTYASQNEAQKKVGGGGTVDLRIAGGKKPTDPSVSVNLGASGGKVETFGPQGKTQNDFTVNLGIVGRF